MSTTYLIRTQTWLHEEVNGERDLIESVTYTVGGKRYRTELPALDLEGPPIAYDPNFRIDLRDVTKFSDPDPEPVRSITFGYDVAKTDSNVTAWCWYCNTTFDFALFSKDCPQAYDEDRLQRAFCYAMLEHHDDCKEEAKGVPFIHYEGRTIVRPDGSVAAKKPDFTGKVPAKLQGPAASWFDPTTRR